MKKLAITFSIPAYNDAHSLKTLLEEIHHFREQHSHFDISILVIDDCSSDNTAEVAMDFARQSKKVELVCHPKNYGFGPTFKEAFTAPRTDWVFFLSGDHQFPVENLLKLQGEMEKYDFILGSRVIRKDNWKRKLYSRIYNGVISILAGKKVKDVNSTILFKRKILDTIDLNSHSAFVNAEFLLKAIKSGHSFVERDIVHKERVHGAGSGGRFDVIVPVIGDVFRYIFKKL